MNVAMPASFFPLGMAALVSIGANFFEVDDALAQAQEADAQSAAQVIVVRAANSCFSSAIPVTGFLVARREAVVVLGPADEVSEILAVEGDTVSADQTLVQVTRISAPRPGTEAKKETIALKSPLAGTIIQSTASIGATFSPRNIEPLFRIAIDGEMELEGEVPSIRVPEISPGQSARIIVKDARDLSGHVRLAPASIDPRTQLGRARITVERGGRLQFGTFATAIINAERSCGIAVPRSAVNYRTGGTNVQIVHNSVIETRSVQIGLHSDTEIEIRKGLNQGDLVVANAGTTLRDGDKVRPVNAATSRSEPR